MGSSQPAMCKLFPYWGTSFSLPQCPWYITCSRQRSTALWKQHAPQLDVTGGVTNVTTLDSAPVGQAPPSSPSMSLQWNAPLQPDYVITAYTLHHRVPSLKSQSDMWGPPSTATVQFHTYNPSGILFHQINSVVTDFLGLSCIQQYQNLHDGQWHTHRYGFDAVSVQNVGSTYIIVSWDLPTHSNGILQL
eukprot:Em0403g4a